jgi:RimJ/RimL family protein N-acetyltransferase
MKPDHSAQLTPSVDNRRESFGFQSDSLVLQAQAVSWDSVALGFPVAQINSIEVKQPEHAPEGFRQFKEWALRGEFQLISCRLPCERLVESMMLEDNGFRYIETVLHPVCRELALFRDTEEAELTICPAEANDLPEIRRIAEYAFTNERHYVDPRLDRRGSGARFSRWAANALSHPTQRLLKVIKGTTLIAFFVTEPRTDGGVYWHLTAVNPTYQGAGYGRRAWTAMLNRHFQEGAAKVSTTIAARNIRVLNLYSSLNFRFLPPEATFHWVRRVS